jgi:hypothetical protein
MTSAPTSAVARRAEASEKPAVHAISVASTGPCVGLAVGLLVASVGDAVGDSEGAAVGDSVGGAVGRSGRSPSTALIFSSSVSSSVDAVSTEHAVYDS